MSQNRKSWSLAAFDPSLILATIATVAFYAVVLQPSMRESFIARYTTEHIVEYVIVALFIWGIIDIVLKLLSFPREFLATRQEWIPARTGREPAVQAQALLEQVRSSPAWMLNTRMGRRIEQALFFVADKGSAEDYADHLRYLADQDDHDLHARYTVIRFVIAVTPILGFLGTVVHFGSAIGGFSFVDMDAKLPEIVGEMGTAFNTTSVALATAMTMMFALFLCERVEQGIVATIDRLIDRELLNRFEVKNPEVVPFLSAIQSANQEALAAISTTLQRQVELWTLALDTLFQQFQERQGQEAARWQEALDALRQRHEANDGAREERLRQLVSLVDARQEKHMAHLQATLERALLFREDLSELLQALHSIARGEGKLVELQTALADNLRVLHETRQIDGALHGLTAAIHLLTARSRQIGLADSAAA